MSDDIDLDFDDDEDLDLDDLDLDDLDLNDLDITDSSDRKPVTKLKNSFVSSISSKLTDRNEVNQMLSRTLPDGYGSVYKEAGGVYDTLTSIYRDTENSRATLKRNAKRALKIADGKIGKFLPKKVRDKIQKLAEEEVEESSNHRAETNEEKIANRLAEIFDVEMSIKEREREEDQLYTQQRDIVSDRMSVESITMQERNSYLLQRLVDYNDRVTSKFQKGSLEVQLQQYYLSKDYFEASLSYQKDALSWYDKISHNSALPDIVKMQSSEIVTKLLREKTYGAAFDKLGSAGKDIAGNILGNLKSRSLAFMQNLAGTSDVALMGVDALEQQAELEAAMGGEVSRSDKIKGKIADFAGSQGGSLVSSLVEREKISKSIDWLVKTLDARDNPKLKDLSSRLQQFKDDAFEDLAKGGHQAEYLSNNWAETLRSFTFEARTALEEEQLELEMKSMTREFDDEEYREAGVLGKIGKTVSTQAEIMKKGVQIKGLDFLSSLIPQNNLEAQYSREFLNLDTELGIYSALTDKTIIETIPALLTDIRNETEMMRKGIMDEDDFDRKTYDLVSGKMTRESELKKNLMEQVANKETKKVVNESLNTIITKFKEFGMPEELEELVKKTLIYSAVSKRDFTIDGLSKPEIYRRISQDRESIDKATAFFAELKKTVNLKDGAETLNELSRSFVSARSAAQVPKEIILKTDTLYRPEVAERMGIMKQGSMSNIRNLDVNAVIDQYREDSLFEIEEKVNDSIPSIDQVVAKTQSPINKDGTVNLNSPAVRTARAPNAFSLSIEPLVEQLEVLNKISDSNVAKQDITNSLLKEIRDKMVDLIEGQLVVRETNIVREPSILERATGAVSDVARSVSDKLTLSEQSREKIDTKKEEARILVEELTDKFKNKEISRETLLQSLSESYSSIKKGMSITEMLDTLRESNVYINKKDFLDRMSKKVKTAKKDVGSYLKRVKNGVTEVYNEAKIEVEQAREQYLADGGKTAGELFDDAKFKMGVYTSEMSSKLKERATDTVEDLTTQATGLKDKAVSTGQKKIEEYNNSRIKQALDSKIDDTKALLQDIVTQVSEGAVNTREEISTRITNVLEVVKEQYKESAPNKETFDLIMSVVGEKLRQLDEKLEDLKTEELTAIVSESIRPAMLNNNSIESETSYDETYWEKYESVLRTVSTENTSLITDKLEELITVYSDISTKGEIRNVPRIRRALRTASVKALGGLSSAYGAYARVTGKAGAMGLKGIFDVATSPIWMVSNKLKGKTLFGKEKDSMRNDSVTDVYVGDESTPRITSKQMAERAIFDAATGDPIRKIGDIKGAVKDKDGLFLIQDSEVEEELVHTRDPRTNKVKEKGIGSSVLGAYGKYFKGASTLSVGALGLAGLATFGVGKLVVDQFRTKKTDDIYVKGESKPRLKGILLRNGGYFSATTGKRIRSVDEIDGDIMDANGRMVLTYDEITDPGIVDHKGSNVSRLLKGIVNPLVGLYGKYFDVTTDLLMKKPARFIGKKLGIGRKEETPAESLSNISNTNEESVEHLKSLQSIMETFKVGNFKRLDEIIQNTAPEEEHHANSWRGQIGSKKKKLKSNNAKTKNLNEDLNRLLLENALADTNQPDSNKNSTIMDIAKGVVGGGLAWMAGKVGLTSLMTGSGLAMKGAIIAGAKALVLGIASAGAAILASPVLLAAAAVAVVAGTGYYIWRKWFRKVKGGIEEARLAQYGYGMKEEEMFAKIQAAEDFLFDKVKLSGSTGEAYIDQRDPLPIYEIFNIDYTNLPQVNQFNTWFHIRFSPIFCSWVKMTKEIGKDSLSDLDDVLKPSEKIVLLEKTLFNSDPSPYSMRDGAYQDDGRLLKAKTVRNIASRLLRELRRLVRRGRDEARELINEEEEKFLEENNITFDSNGNPDIELSIEDARRYQNNDTELGRAARTIATNDTVNTANTRAGFNNNSLMSFEGGGFTGSGPREGGVDGRGGFYAIVHPDEKIVDLKENNSATMSNRRSSMESSMLNSRIADNTEKQVSLQEESLSELRGIRTLASEMVKAIKESNVKDDLKSIAEALKSKVVAQNDKTNQTPGESARVLNFKDPIMKFS